MALRPMARDQTRYDHGTITKAALVRAGFLNVLMNTAAVKDLHAGWLQRPEIRPLVARRVLELDLLAELLGLASRAELNVFEEHGHRRLWVPASAPADRVNIQLAFTGAESVGTELVRTLIGLSLGEPGDLRSSARIWTEEQLPSMTWVADELLIAFHRILAHLVNTPNVPLPPIDSVVLLPALRLHSDLDVPYSAPTAGTPIDAAEATLEEFYQRSRQELAAQRRRAEGRRPQKTGDDYFRWGEMACRHMVEKVSIKALTREEYGENDWHDRSSGIRHRLREAQRYLEAPLPTQETAEGKIYSG